MFYPKGKKLSVPEPEIFFTVFCIDVQDFIF